MQQAVSGRDGALRRHRRVERRNGLTSAFTQSIPRLNGAGTAQRAVPTGCSALPTQSAPDDWRDGAPSGEEAPNSTQQLRPSRAEQRDIKEVQGKRDTAAGGHEQKQPYGQL